MNRIFAIVLFAFMVAVCGSAYAAADKTNKGPEVINLQMGVMVLPFKHHEHQRVLKEECFQCHASKIGKIDGWGKETAHKICIACHELEDKGPTQCRQCHTKR